MNLSAILVISSPAQVERCMALLDTLPGIAVHHADPATGKIVITQEAASTSAEVEGLKRIKALNEVLMAEMIYHYFEDDETLETAMPAGLDEFQGLGELPEFLSSRKE